MDQSVPFAQGEAHDAAMPATPHEAPHEALGVALLAAAAGSERLVLVAHSEAQAARLARAAEVLAPAMAPMLLPAWDCLPFDRVGPSRAVMGRRMAIGAAAASGETRLLVASVEALAQRLPRPNQTGTLVVAAGQTLRRADLLAELGRLGYGFEDEADQPGEVAVRGAVIDIFPADRGPPVRMRLEGDEAATRVTELDLFDPATQRSRGILDTLSIGPASELVFPPGSDAAPARRPGIEHDLPALVDNLVSAFDLMPEAAVMLDEDAADRMGEHLAQVAEACATRVALARASDGALPPIGLYIGAEDWDAIMRRPTTRPVPWPLAGVLPDFRTHPDPVAAVGGLIAERIAAGCRIGLSGRRLARALRQAAPVAEGWAALADLPKGSVAVLPSGLAHGFATEGVVVLGEADVLPPPRGAARAVQAGLFDVPLRPGDAVIHLDYGMARLDGIETVQCGGQPSDCLVLGFAGEARKLVPCAEMDRVWRYGSGKQGVRLDRADGTSWRRRQGTVLRALDETAARLVAAGSARARLRATVIRPPRRAFDRFAAGFAFTPTDDQAACFADIASDLARPHPMDRLLCGDVGFGKTEAALRAAAAVALAGHQVAVLAPTTVLVRQHLATFRRRFAPLGIEVASLSRLTLPAEARAIRRQLADGRLRVVIGTGALAGKDVVFADLALLVIDEEQRFGAKAKAALATLREGAPDRAVHVLTLTATPIPRTLQGALAGLQSLSILATPPAQRQPVRTSVMPLDEAVVQAALSREHARGGQSFCVCPRIEDLDGVAALLDRLVPDLSVVILHGKLKPDAVDAALVGFAEGHGDVLLSTDIIEAGLDVPRANTIMVWGAERFGLAQLHQLRGRVGRGRVRGMAWLFTDPANPAGECASDRLAALAAYDGLGAGFAVAARDLDIRGAGDLLGEDQAGHTKLLGVELARYLLERATARARGETPDEAWRPEMVLDLPSAIPPDYMPDVAARIGLHARLARPESGDRDLDGLAEELGDRFGTPPDSVRHLLAQSALRAACVRLGIARLEAGPTAVAADMRGEPPEVTGLERKGRRLLLRRPSANADERLEVARDLLRAIERQ